jgi:hypothetical protein
VFFLCADFHYEATNFGHISAFLHDTFLSIASINRRYINTKIYVHIISDDFVMKLQNLVISQLSCTAHFYLLHQLSGDT